VVLRESGGDGQAGRFRRRLPSKRAFTTSQATQSQGGSLTAGALYTGVAAPHSSSASDFDRDELPTIVATAVALAVLAWLLPAFATLAHARAWPELNAGEAIAGTGRVIAEGRLSDPRRAYPPRARRAMPTGRSWWLAAGAPLALMLGAGLIGWRRLDPLRARTLLGRRGYDPRGADPREWARPRDLGALVVRGRQPGRFTLGRLDRRLLASDGEAHVAVIAPTRSGKTTRCVVPWLLEHDGPAIVASVKRDVLAETISWRRRLGPVHVWDPGAPDCAGWTPLEGCAHWGHALRQGLWLADAVDHAEHGAARFWNQEAAKLLSPLLHAAALNATSIEAVIAWLDTQAVDEPAEILDAAGASAARRQLHAVAGLDPRNRGTTYMSAGSLLAAYRHPDVRASARPELTPDRFLDGGTPTLYICSPERRQRELAPLVVALLSGMLEAAAVRATTQGALSPTLRILLDEAANIAPLSHLPQHLSQAAAHGVRIATVWQSLAQARERYHDGADSILANSTAKLFMGPITDTTTRSYVEQLLGHEPQQHDDHKIWRPKAPAQALQQLGQDRALLVSGNLPPAIVRLHGYWRTRGLARRSAIDS
jgi:type IV secretion system protein VirD4